MSQARLEKIKHVLNRRQIDVGVLLDCVHKQHNLSAIMRTCDAVGIPEVNACENDKGDIRTFAGATAGSHKWVTLNRERDLKVAITAQKATGRLVLAAHLSQEAVDFRNIDWCQPVCILMGAEKTGVSDLAAEMADQHVTIPMHGMVESLNVSVAFALIAFEMERQRKAAGLYDHQENIDEQILFEWMQPKMSRFYRERGQAYPPIDEDGDIIWPR